LEELGEAGGESSVAHLIEQTGLDRTTVQRIVRTLHAEGYVQRTGRGEYAVAARGYVLGAMLSKGGHLALAAEPILAELQRQTGESIHLGVLEGTDVVCISHIPSGKMLAFNFPVGARLPAYSSSLGRSMLAHMPSEHAMRVLKMSDRRRRTERTVTSLKDLTAELDRVRENGYCTVESEVELGVSSVAAPVLRSNGEALAAINVVVPATRIDKTRGYEVVIPAVRRAAESLSRELGWAGPRAEAAAS
jgi:IclR family pca regulon transcriptional regulator